MPNAAAFIAEPAAAAEGAALVVVEVSATRLGAVDMEVTAEEVEAEEIDEGLLLVSSTLTSVKS